MPNSRHPARSKTWRIAGVGFDHMHMGHLLTLAAKEPNAEVVGICDSSEARMQRTREKLGLNADRVFTDAEACIERSKPDLIILCSTTAQHAVLVERLAPYGSNFLVEKPFASSLSEADRMIAATTQAGRRLIINWPIRWVPSHATAMRIVEQGLIGEVLEIHAYGGNRGPLLHDAGETETEHQPKATSWFYRKAEGGGSLFDYLGYGATFGSWYMKGRTPHEVTAVTDAPDEGSVDEQSVTLAKYKTGLSTFQTRWGTFTNPWVYQPQPKCGFNLVGSEGTLSSYDLECSLRIQTRARPAGMEIPVDTLQFPFQNPIQYVLNRFETDLPVEGPLDYKISRIGQQIIDTAVESARRKQTISLLG